MSVPLSVVWKTRDVGTLSLLQRSVNAVSPDAERIVVVEGGELMVEVSDALPDDVFLVRTDNTALTVGRNIGAKAASRPYVGFMDDDAVPSGGWIAAILDALNHADAAGGPLVPPENWERRRIWIPDTWHWLIGCGPYYDRRRLVPNTYASNFVVDRGAFWDVDGFDESIGMGTQSVWQGAETDLANRLRESGYRATMYHPDAKVTHYPSDVGAGPVIWRAYHQGMAKAHIGVGEQETGFVKREIRACLHRPVHHSTIAGLLTGLVAAGYVRGRLRTRD